MPHAVVIKWHNLYYTNISTSIHVLSVRISCKHMFNCAISNLFIRIYIIVFIGLGVRARLGPGLWVAN